MFSELRSLREGLSRLVADLEPGLVSGADAVKLVRGFAAIAKLANAGQTLAANRVAETGTWATQGDRSAAHFLARTTGTSTGQAINAMETAKRLTELPATEAALRAGELSQPQADEIASAAAADPGAEADVLRTARRDSLKGLRQRCRRVRAAALPDEVSRHEAVRKSRYLRHWSDADGAFRMDLRTTPDDGAAILAGLRPFREEIFLRARQAGQREPYEAYQAYALVAMAEAAAGGGGNGRGGSPSGPRATVQVRVDHEALLRGHVEAGETCEVEGVGPIPVATARSMMADAVLSAILTRGTEVTKVVHLGRTVSAHQRTALEARDPVCIVPGCDVAERLEIDHRTGWALTQQTCLDDLARLCRWHHHLKTHRGYRYEGGPGRWRWVHPDGRVDEVASAPPPGPTGPPSPDAAPDGDAATEAEAPALLPLDLDPGTGTGTDPPWA
ncbi:MAG: DUF222 domain-containing protein [Acidimicrobiales bacterium]